jgi:cobalt/nickel transport system ATP-binding protein
MSADAVIQVRNLVYSYPGGRRALDDISMTIGTGAHVGLIGPNGAGKTTLFLCLSGVIKAGRGVISLAGLDPSEPAQRRVLPSKVGIVFQNSDDQIFSATVFDDVAFGPLNLGLSAAEVKERVASGLEQAGLRGFDDRVPYHLSSGEKRRTALAGVLAMRPEILLLDEPSVYLDPRGRREFIRLLPALRVTRIIASHDLELIRETCNRVILIDSGRVMADGPTDQILANPELMNAHGLEVPHSLSHHNERHHG